MILLICLCNNRKPVDAVQGNYNCLFLYAVDAHKIQCGEMHS